MELANYLKFLLYNHNSVTIPGLGTLVTNYKHAEINESEKTISPPSKFLTFIADSDIDDELLLNYIAHSNEIDINQAKIELERLIHELNQKLDNEETVFLEGIGYFAKDEGFVRFDREQDTNFLTDSFGLTKIDFEPIHTEFVKHSPELIKPQAPKKYTSLVITLLLLLIVGGAVVTYLNYPDLINFKFKKKSVTPVMIPALKDTLKQSTVITDTASKINKDIEKFYESATDKKNALAIATPQTGLKNKYYIIAGSFLTYEKAEIMAKEIQKDGYKTEIIKFGDKIRISLGVFTDKEKALVELEKIRYNKGDNSVWLLTQPQ